MSLSEIGALLLASGLTALLLLFLVALFQIWRSSAPKAGWFSGILFLTAALTLFVVLVINTFATPVTPTPGILITLVCVAGLILGIGLLLLERRKDTFLAANSPSLLFLASIILVGAFAVFIPVLPGQFWPESASVPAATAAIAAEPSMTPTQRPSPTATALPTETPTYTPLPPTLPPTATPTRERYSTRTPTPTPAIPRFCGAVIDYNLNLRPLRSAESEVLAVIPFGSIVDVGGRSTDSEWWFIEYNGEWGWVMSEYITLEPQCEGAPIVP